MSTIGVAYDGSIESRGALIAAARTAEALGAQLTLISVVPEDLYATWGLVAGRDYGPLHDQVEKDIRRDLDDVLATLPGAEGVVLGRPSRRATRRSHARRWT